MNTNISNYHFCMKVKRVQKRIAKTVPESAVTTVIWVGIPGK